MAIEQVRGRGHESQQVGSGKFCRVPTRVCGRNQAVLRWAVPYSIAAAGTPVVQVIQLMSSEGFRRAAGETVTGHGWLRGDASEWAALAELRWACLRLDEC